MPTPSPLTILRQSLAAGDTTPSAIAADCLAHASSNASRNTYIHLEPAALLQQAAALTDPSAPVYGIPISLKDCFNLAGTVTSAGTRFYANLNPPAAHDSAIAARIKATGALITGKTHLHPLAYGITGQNPDFGDCLQPRDPTLLTGGSSSGAVASVQEGSALAAIGTDTGGSIRVPAALCGLTGYRASHALAYADGPWPSSSEGIWAGGLHLAPSFDTIGFFVRDPRDAAPIASALFGLPLAPTPDPPRIGFVSSDFLYDAAPEVLASFAAWQEFLTPYAAGTATFDSTWWSDSRDIVNPIQASEAAAIHTGHFDQFEHSIVQRLHYGAGISPGELTSFRQRHAAFRTRIARLFAEFDLLALPCAPVSRLLAAADHTHTRASILRYTTPFSLAGVPVLSLPGEIIGAPFGTGLQLAAPSGEDASLLAFAASLSYPCPHS